ncbi:hypothetical protein [Burkholderia mayonis]|uniref:hypothetical protein n=1 Tax=Burkholderia mayonis TaxID=1385591 RepID=UPI00131F07B2|nr:hypothetical protein [Burkholderia mayonis]
MRKHSSLRRRPLTKAQLLPRPVDQVRRLSLKHHLALALLCDDSGDVESIATLSNMLALAFYLRSDGEAELYRSADSALNQRSGRKSGQPFEAQHFATANAC